MLCSFKHQAPFCQIFLSVVRSLNINKGVDNDFICDYSSSLSVDNDHMEAENYVDNFGLFEESDDDIKADYFSSDG